jgi:very-short-patch-repair endonuclease
MWNFVTPANLIDFQRRAAFESLGERVLRLHREGYGVDADRVLDEMLERRREWEASTMSGDTVGP